MTKIFDFVKPGVITGEDVQKVFQVAKENNFAIPVVNVVGTNTINGVMEAAKVVNSPVIIQLSNGGAAFYAGKAVSSEGHKNGILGGVSAAYHIHLLEKFTNQYRI